MIKTIFYPEKKRVKTEKETLLSDLVLQAGIGLNTVCGGNGLCGKCRVRVLNRGVSISSQEKKIFTNDELKEGWRLACQQKVREKIEVEVPETSCLFGQKILADGEGRRNVRLNPFVKKTFISFNRPSLKEQLSYLDKIKEKSKTKGEVNLSFLRKINLHQDKEKWDFTLITAGKELVGIEDGNTQEKNYGIAFDLGTTTIVGYLVDLFKGKEIGHIVTTNPQIKFGEDVVSRISHCKNDGGLLELHKEVIDCFNRMIKDICRDKKITPSHIYQITVAGNTTMQHLFLGVDPSSLAKAPYIGIFREPIEIEASSIGLKINLFGRVLVLPSIAGFVGGDTVAFILSHFSKAKNCIKLGIDIGTNGEVVLGRRGEILACSTAAGPAFEGARISHGMRAEIGAIDRIQINNGDLKISLIGEGKAKGICGSGLVSVVAKLLDAGIIDEMGRIKDRVELKGRAPEKLLLRIIENKDRAFLLEDGITLTQKDIRELQLAKAAIRAGIEILLNEWGMKVDELDEVLLAGAFGSYIDKKEAMRIGMLPSLPPNKIKSVGNASGTGAKMYLFNKFYRKRGKEISSTTKYIELAGRKDFMEKFSNFILFPKSHSIPQNLL